MKLSDGTLAEPVQIELEKIFIINYKNFSLKFKTVKGRIKTEEPVELDLTGPITVLVGPNGSGKTRLLEAVRLFCIAIRHGSGCLSSIEAAELFDDNGEFGVSLKGVFCVHYRDTDDIQKFQLEVALISIKTKREIYNTCTKSPVDMSRMKLDERSSKECVHVYVTIPREKAHYSLKNWRYEFCPMKHNPALIYRTDYGILGNLFPQIILFNSKNVLNSGLHNLFNQNPEIRKHQEEISEDIRRIFPSIQLTYSKIMKSSKGDDPRIPVINKTGISDSYSNSRQTSGDIAFFGEGILQCIILIITVCCAKPFSIITIDEPDAHVFPTAQKLLINFFYRKMETFRQSNHFCRMLITTHSPDIMQAVKLEDIRQIFLDPIERKPLGLKSLAHIGQFYNALTEVGASFLSHGELVRLGVHRKLLYLEGDDDYDFLHGILNKIRPELLSLPFTKISRGGRVQPSQIKTLIQEFQKFLPENTVFHIFILVDADLRSKSVLEKEKEDYDKIQNETNVKIYYHCWSVREWENWLLYNENLLYEMFCNNELYDKDPAIKQLRDRIQQHRPNEPIFHTPNAVQQSQPMTTTSITTVSAPPYSVDKQDFYYWFTKELQRCFEILYNQLTLSQMGGTEINEQNSKDIDLNIGNDYLKKAGITDDVMEKLGYFNRPVREFIGQLVQQQREPKKKRPKNNPNKAANDLEKCRKEWLKDKHLLEMTETNYTLDEQLRTELEKWIDAKLFFHQLTNGIGSPPVNIDLDEFWRQAFSQNISGENNLYGRYFNSFNHQQYPQDFLDLIENFKIFVEA